MTRPRRPSPYHHGSLADTALAAAIAALDADGALPPLRVLADRCGVTHTALYRHFDDLDGLGLAVATRCYEEIAAAMRAGLAAARTPATRFRALGAAYARWGLEHPGRYLFMTSATFANRTAHAPFLAAATAAFEPLVAAVAALGAAEPCRSRTP
ncbi:MAG: TetR/AcrR family transcriptional regulator [Vicinamibacterales bacterium]